MATLLAVTLALGQASPGLAAQNEAVWPFDYVRLCRQTEHIPLVQAGIDPRFIAMWTERESRRAGRYEQYSYGTRRIDVRVNDEISLFHGLIHRTLDLIGESRLKYADASPNEDYEHWLIYYTLELHWPGEQRRKGREPSRAALRRAAEFWSAKIGEYARINEKARQMAEHSWCATHKTTESAALSALPYLTPTAGPTNTQR